MKCGPCSGSQKGEKNALLDTAQSYRKPKEKVIRCISAGFARTREWDISNDCVQFTVVIFSSIKLTLSALLLLPKAALKLIKTLQKVR